MTPLAQWAVKNYTPEVRNVGLILILILIPSCLLRCACDTRAARSVQSAFVKT